MSEYEPSESEVETLAARLDRGFPLYTSPTGLEARLARYILRHYEPRTPALYPGKCLFGGCDKDAVVERCREHLLRDYEPRNTEQRCDRSGWFKTLLWEPSSKRADQRSVTSACPGCTRCQPKATPKGGGDCARDDSPEPTELEQIAMARGPVAALAAEGTNRTTPKSDNGGQAHKPGVEVDGEGTSGRDGRAGSLHSGSGVAAQTAREGTTGNETLGNSGTNPASLAELRARSSPRLHPTQEDFEKHKSRVPMLANLGIVAVQIRDLLVELRGTTNGLA